MCLFVDCSVATDQDFHLSLSHYDYYFKILSLHIYIDCMLCVMVYTDTATASFYAILCDHFILAHPYNVCSFTLRKHLFICARDTFSKRIFATQTRVSKRPSNQPANRANAVEDKSCNSVKLLNYHEPMMFICVYAFAHAHWVCVCVCAWVSERVSESFRSHYSQLCRQYKLVNQFTTQNVKNKKKINTKRAFSSKTEGDRTE